jgi:hypothetical protein
VIAYLKKGQFKKGIYAFLFTRLLRVLFWIRVCFSETPLVLVVLFLLLGFRRLYDRFHGRIKILAAQQPARHLLIYLLVDELIF